MPFHLLIIQKIYYNYHVYYELNNTRQTEQNFTKINYYLSMRNKKLEYTRLVMGWFALHGKIIMAFSSNNCVYL